MEDILDPGQTEATFQRLTSPEIKKKFPKGSKYVAENLSELKASSQRVTEYVQQQDESQTLDEEVHMCETLIGVWTAEFNDATAKFDFDRKKESHKALLESMDQYRKMLNTRKQLEMQFGTFGLSTIIVLVQKMKEIAFKYITDPEARKDLAWELRAALPLPKSVVNSRALAEPVYAEVVDGEIIERATSEK